MSSRTGRSTTPTTLLISAFSVFSALTLSACAGGVGAGSSGGADASGFTYGADQAEIDALLAELEPVEIVFQGTASSPNSLFAPANNAFAEYVEERSGGKITIDMIYGQAIAGYTELDDALVDGRVDIAYTLPSYDAAKYPAYNEFMATTAEMPASPLVGELVTNGMVFELGWGNENIVGAFEEHDLVPLAAVNLSAASYSVCTEPGVGADDWTGRQVRSGSPAATALIQGIGASPVSIEYTETYEALQRGTIDCTFIQLSAVLESGYLEVAPNISYAYPAGIPRNYGAWMAGPEFLQLPLPYQQILFDAFVAMNAEGMKNNIESHADAVAKADEFGGAVETWAEDTMEDVGASNAMLIDESKSAGNLGGDFDARFAESQEKWEAIVSELGYTDGGELTDMPTWFDAEGFDAMPFSEKLFEEVLSAHRPS